MRGSRAWLFFLLAEIAAAPTLASDEPARGQFVEGRECVADPTQTYTLYLPSAYDSQRKWPTMIIMDPRGRSLHAAERFRGAAEDYGWILLSSDNTRSDQSAEPNVRALNALLPELRSEYSVDERRIYLAGFSGTAMMAWEVARQRPGLAGVIASGSRFEPQASSEMTVPSFGAAGDTDFNYREMQRVHQALRRWRTPERLEIFEGPHQWMPEDLARRSVEWMELQAMKSGRRETSTDLISRLQNEDQSRTLRLEEEGRELEALRQWRNVATTYQGLVGTDDAEHRIAELEQSDTVKTALKEEKRLEQMEVSYGVKLSQASARLRQDGRFVTASQLRNDLGIETLRRRSKARGYEGVVARRVLATYLTQTSFYLSRELLGAGNHRGAAAVLTVATELAAERSDIWYNLACALAQSGQKKKALAALEESINRGFRNHSLLETDEDLESLRNLDAFRDLLKSLEAGAL